MASEYLIKNGYIGVKQTRHGLFMFNRNDTFIGRSLDLYGEWCESEIDLLRRFLRPGDAMVDVGANIGTHAVALARVVGDSGSVLAFEPQRLAFHLLCGNVALNCLTNVSCRQQGVGESKRTAVAPRFSPHESRNFGAVGIGSAAAGDEIEVVTIDSLELPACRLIKIDVEGMEAEVIRGARATIARHRPVLLVENNTIETASAALGAILDAGYQAWWHLALYYSSANFFGNPENVFAKYKPEANLLCLPAGASPGVAELVSCTGVDDNWKKALERGIAEGNPRFFRPP